MNKTAIVSGANGQDGSFLSELLLNKDYEVMGISRRSSRHNTNLDRCLIHPNFHLVELDITDVSGIRNLVKDVKPSEFYNLAAVSHVGQSFKEPLTTLMVDGYAVVGMLEAIRNESPKTRFMQASSSEMMGGNVKPNAILNISPMEIGIPKQDENTMLIGNSPYAIAKIYSHQMVGLYRKSYGLHASCAISFNHEGIRRSLDFVTRKITNGVARISLGLSKTIKMGNLDAYRDIGNSEDFVNGFWLMLQQDVPDDYVFATGETVSVREMLQYACGLANLDWQDVYEMDERFMRPSDVPYLCGDANKAKEVLGWEPIYLWKDTLKEMYENDFSLLSRENRSDITVPVC